MLPYTEGISALVDGGPTRCLSFAPSSDVRSNHKRYDLKRSTLFIRIFKEVTAEKKHAKSEVSLLFGINVDLRFL